MIQGFKWVEKGKIATMPHPNKEGEIEENLEALKKTGVKSILSVDEYGLQGMSDKLNDFNYLHIPVADMTCPTVNQIDEFLQWWGRDEGPVVIHCWQGIGRSGVFAGCWLRENGYGPNAAVCKLNQRSYRWQMLPIQDDFVVNYIPRDRRMDNGREEPQQAGERCCTG
jgi:atypical dual specificity phosphatase